LVQLSNAPLPTSSISGNRRLTIDPGFATFVILAFLLTGIAIAHFLWRIATGIDRLANSVEASRQMPESSQRPEKSLN